MKEAILSTLFTGIVCLFIGNRIHIGSEAALRRENRRRDFCDALRPILIQLDDARNITRLKIYRETLPTVKLESSKVFKDIHRWRRTDFRHLTKTYSGFTDADIEPPPPSAAATPEEMAALKKKYESAKRLLHDTLERLIRYAE